MITPRTLKGLTLIEILIVLLIIGIITSIAVLTPRHHSRQQFALLANQLTQALNLAEQEALLRPATLGASVTPRAFQVYIYQQQHWHTLHSYPLSENTEVQIQISEQVATPKNQPQLIISPSGDLTPFIILVGKKRQTPYYQITGNANGEIKNEIFRPKD